MRDPRTVCRSLIVLLLVVGVGTGGLTGCGGSENSGAPKTLNMVTVNWIEGLAMTYLQEQVLEDSLGVDVDVKEVQGRGIAFASVASGDRDVFNEAWLPTTHQEAWARHKDDLQKLGYTYRGTTVGLAVPTYMEVDTFPDLATYRGELDGTINGIESGAAINDQTRRTLERYGMADAFSVRAASGPATWQALESAIENREPIVVVAWYPHWKWSEFDLKYVDGAKTNHNVDIWGRPEDIFTLVDNAFIGQFPERVVCFLETFEATDDQLLSLMSAFRNRGDASKREAVRQWIGAHPEAVTQWLRQTDECVASEERPTPLPDSAAYSTQQAKTGAP